MQREGRMGSLLMKSRRLITVWSGPNRCCAQKGHAPPSCGEELSKSPLVGFAWRV